MALRRQFTFGSMSFAWLCSLLLMIGTATAQQNASEGMIAKVTNPPESSVSSTDKSSTVNLEEMMATIKRLEARVKELEAKATEAPPPPVNSLETDKAVQSIEQDVAALKEEAKKNSGFASFLRNTTISGFVDTYYSYNFNKPLGDYQLRNFDTKHNQFGLNLMELALEKVPTTESRVGFRMDLNYGPATEIVHSFEPVNGPFSGIDVFRNIQQGYVSYLVPAGKGIQIDAGKFVTQHGAEVIETKDNWNYSRSLLFALAIPYYHFGVRATYPVHDKFTLSGFVVNGWNNVVENNGGKTYGIMAIIKPTSKLTLVQNYMGGPEQPNNKDDWRHLYDATAIYSPASWVSLMANYDYGADRVGGVAVNWQGLAAYAKFQANSWFALIPRFEWYDDHDGFTTGLAQTIKEITLTTEQKISGSLLTRFEYRRDFSNQEYFTLPGDRVGKSQSTLAFGIIYAFTSKGDQ